MNKIYLPSSSDWGFWHKLENELGVYDQKNNHSLNVITSDEIRLLTIFSRELLEVRPYTLKQITEIIEDDSLQSFSAYNSQILYTISNNQIKDESKKRLLSKELLDFSKKGFIDVITLKEYSKEFHWDEDLHASSAIYPITTKGIIAYELALTMPLLSFTILPFKVPYTINDFFLNIGILNRETRFRWNYDFLKENLITPHHFHLKRIADLKENFSESNYELFWNMASLSTLLLREFSALNHIISACDKFISELKKEDRISNTTCYEKKTESNLLVTAKHEKEYANMLLNNYIFPLWEKIGGKKRDLEKFAPPSKFMKIFDY